MKSAVLTERSSESPTQPYTASEVASLLRVGVPTVYEWSRERPTEVGAFRVGRAVRFRRRVIDELVTGTES